MADVKLNGTVSIVDRRQRYLAAALRLFGEQGFNGVTMDEIVAATGGSKATLYRYFPSKESLFEAIISDIVGAKVAPAVPDDEWDNVGLDEGLRALGRAVAAGALDERTIVLLRLAAGEHSRFPTLGRILFDRGPGSSYTRMRDFLASAVERGLIEVPDLQIAAEQFLGGIVGHQQLRMTLGLPAPTAPEIEARIEAAVHSFRATYAADRRRHAR